MLKWPDNDPSVLKIPNPYYIKTVILALNSESSFVQVSALHAAWAYRVHIHNLTDQRAAHSLVKWPGKRPWNVSRLDVKEDFQLSIKHMEEVFRHYIGLIRAILVSPVPIDYLLCPTLP